MFTERFAFARVVSKLKQAGVPYVANSLIVAT